MTNGTDAWHDRDVDLQIYDRLPKQTRRFYQNAPFNAPAELARGFQRRWSLDDTEIVEELESRMEKYVRKQILATYGPNHPQCRREDSAEDRN